LFVVDVIIQQSLNLVNSYVQYLLVLFSKVYSMNVEMCSRLKEERERIGFTQQQLADVGGVTKTTLFNYENGREPSSGFIAAISKVGVDVSYIITGERTTKQVVKLMPANDMVYIPRYDVRASAGGGQLIGEEMIVDYMAFKQEWLNKMRLQRDQLALIEVHGDSMEPVLQNNDLILIDLRFNQLKENDIYAFQYKGHLRVKRLQVKLDGTVIIKSDNPHYEIEYLTAEEAESLHLIGRVAWYGRGM
jgi:phage repressor protein C with HTH and peptisase S24 domain/DNA-binding XRE family transcriptional regulator